MKIESLEARALLTGVPPFWGTIFIDPDIVTPSDPTTFQSTSYIGQGFRQMYDRRVNNWVVINAYLFDTHFADGLTTEIEVNPEFGSPAAALIEAQKYGAIIGQLPRALRIDVDAVWIHKGTQPFGGGNRSLLIHTGQADLYAADGILEEVFVHEASHTSLDASHASSPGWLAAQSADDNFISSYALDNPTREDVAESFLPYLAVRFRLSRISQSLANTILQTIPNRISYFDTQDFDMSPQNVDNASVVGRHLFYNQSGTSTRYDGNNLAINASDDAAIATDKTAYLWENPGAATFANVSGYTKGINGIMVDISGSHPNISTDDFIFRVGNNNSPGKWATIGATSISVRAGAGVGGSDRVTIIWNTGAPIKQWLQVIVLANADTGLAQKAGHPVGHGDAFFFGSAPGNTGTGDTVANAQVNALDEGAIRANNALLSANIPITNLYDVNRNASVNSTDESAVRLNSTNPITTLKYLNLTTAPAAPEADGGDEISSLVATDSDVAAGLAAPALANLEDGVPKWLVNRVESIDLNSGSPAKLFQHLHDANTPRSRALLQKFDAVADTLGLDDELLDSLLADLGR